MVLAAAAGFIVVVVGLVDSVVEDTTPLFFSSLSSGFLFPSFSVFRYAIENAPVPGSVGKLKG